MKRISSRRNDPRWEAVSVEPPLKGKETGMELEFVCRNDGCRDKDGPYVYRMSIEAVMDEKNVADVFCPRCNRRLKPQTVDSDAA